MSWLARSIANSLRIDDDEEEEENSATPIPKPPQSEHDDENEENRSARGVREDLSEFTETLTRQLWGVASFLAPPPPPPPPPPPYFHRIDRSVSDRDRWEPPRHSGSGDDSDEEGTGSVGISGSHDEFINGLPDRSRNRVESEIWKMDSNFVAYEQEDPIGDAVGITEEVLAFAMNIAHHPETWLDFPLEEEDDVDDFDMSNAQVEHVLAIQRLAHRLAALRIELCPAHMSEGYFWKVYFVLLHSRLNTRDAKLLSTTQIVEARAMWMKELQKRTKAETDWFGRGTSYVRESANTWQEPFDHVPSDDAPGNMSPRTLAFEPATAYSVTTEFETVKHPVVSTDMQIVDKSVIEEEPVMKTKDKDFVAGPSFKVPVQNYDEDDDDDDWLKDDSELIGCNGTAIFFGNNDDVSFSDLEDDDDCTMPIKSKIVTTTETS
ncbi:hypothetical protein HYC85_008346 [Camellia sinensis]|uniref:BSD domain-containing protein n=1 Tax=Camellia sinensis TaxID=4442 RepID=A0A7J7HRI5_CAMSI|nr:hypothetical protein HYC85_008346 [Camellia sinensis]